MQAVGPQGEGHRVFVDYDKNGKQAKLEITTKRLHLALQKVHPDVKCFVMRRLGTVRADWIDLARVTVPDRDSYKIEWNLGLARENKIDMEAVAKAMAADDKERPAIEWG